MKIRTLNLKVRANLKIILNKKPNQTKQTKPLTLNKLLYQKLLRSLHNRLSNKLKLNKQVNLKILRKVQNQR